MRLKKNNSRVQNYTKLLKLATICSKKCIFFAFCNLYFTKTNKMNARTRMHAGVFT